MLSDDLALISKQFIQIAKTLCPQPPVRVAKGVLIQTIISTPIADNKVKVTVGSPRCFYMPFTNEPWLNRKISTDKWIEYLKKDATKKQLKTYYTKKWEERERALYNRFKWKMEYGDAKLQKNPNEHWWDKAVAQIIALTAEQERGVIING